MPGRLTPLNNVRWWILCLSRMQLTLHGSGSSRKPGIIKPAFAGLIIQCRCLSHAKSVAWFALAELLDNQHQSNTNKGTDDGEPQLR